MEYSPPPLFKQGASARAKVVFFSLIALILLVADSRLRSLVMIRQAVGTALYPVEAAALLPRDAAYAIGGYFTSLAALQKENRRLREQQLSNAQALQQGRQLQAENDQLRRLLDAHERVPLKSVMAEILFDARDPFTRKIIVDRGARSGVEPGQPVIDDLGVVGQVTRVFPLSAEVALLTDKDQALPVQVLRSGLRSVAYGQGNSGALDLRFVPTNADVRNGDILVTSGLDGIYPAGLAVAKVVHVENKSSDPFEHITCQPLAGIDRNRQLLILLADSRLPVRPADDAQPAAGKTDAAAKGGAKAAAKDASVHADKNVSAKPAPAAPATHAAGTPSPAVAPKPSTPAPKAAAVPASAKPPAGKAAP